MGIAAQNVAKPHSLVCCPLGLRRALLLVHAKGDSDMDRSLAELEVLVRNRICSVCTERTVAGQCGLEPPSSCALFRLFPQVAQAIQSVRSDDIEQYIEAIDRKSTRLNSSHLVISYAVFCLKKK